MQGAATLYHVYTVRVATGNRSGRACANVVWTPASTIRFPFTCSRLTKTSVTGAGVPADRARGGRVLSLPMYPELTDAQVEAVPPRWGHARASARAG